MHTVSALSFLAMAATGLASSSVCPFNYPTDVNTTESHVGLSFAIKSNNPATNGRVLQLRTNPFFEGGYFVGIDDHSPVLLAQLRAGAIYSEGRTLTNQLYDLGPTGYLNLNTQVDNTFRWTVGFANSTIWPHFVDDDWYLLGGDSQGSYNLFQRQAVDVTSGFLLCDGSTDASHGPWYQLFYQNSTTNVAEFPTCENVGVQTTVAATIVNGDCDIAGYTASE